MQLWQHIDHPRRTDDLNVIIFDLDGTLLDSAPGIISSLTLAVRQLGHDFQPPADIQKLIGPPMNEIVAQLLRPFGDDRVKRCVDTYREHYRQHGLYECTPYPAIREVLDILASRGYSLFVATSKRQAFADQMLRHTELYDRFEKILGTSPDGTLDDKADLLKLMCLSFNNDPSSTFMIGDKRDDMIAARQNRILPIGAAWGYGTLSELIDSGAEVLAQTPEALPDLLEGLRSFPVSQQVSNNCLLDLK